MQQEKLFKLNRFYLLIIMFISIVIPLINITIPESNPLYWSDYVFSEGLVSTTVAETTAVSENIFQWSWYHVLMGSYLIGVFVMCYRFLSSYIKIAFLLKQGEKIQKNGYTLVWIENDLPVFSFFKYVFFYKNHEYSEKEKKVILAHELAHIKERHTIDIIFSELLKIVLWFNPIIYLFQSKLKELHEYLADEAVIKSQCTPFQYATLMMQEARKNNLQVIPVTHSFHHQLKKRLLMLDKPANRVKGFRILLSLPILLLLIIAFSASGNPTINGWKKGFDGVWVLQNAKERNPQNIVSNEEISSNEKTEEEATSDIASDEEREEEPLSDIESNEESSSNEEGKLNVITNYDYPPNAKPGRCYAKCIKPDNEFSQWEEVVCPKDLTVELLLAIKNIFRNEGYEISINQSMDEAIIDDEFKNVLWQYQKDNELSIGQLTMETIRNMNIAMAID